MGISKAWRLGGFIAALGASGALVAAATGATGAYFTDSHDGAINASTGSVKVSTTDLSLNFTGLLPGEFQTKDVQYWAEGSGAEDIWLVLPNDGTANALNQVPTDDPNAATPLGRYGHFAITSPAGSFTSFNLATSADSGPHSGPSCSVNADGHGGSSTQAANRDDKTVPFCPVPSAILLSSNLTAGQTGTAHITFGFTKLMNAEAQQNLPLTEVAKFQIVATQHGILPSDDNN
jgi:hypothetical protein